MEQRRVVEAVDRVRMIQVGIGPIESDPEDG